MSENSLLYTADDAVDLTGTGEVLKLEIKDRDQVSVILHGAGANADYLVEVNYEDSDTDTDWHAVADNDATQSFRFQGTVPERWIRVRIDSAATAGTGHLSITATK